VLTLVNSDQHYYMWTSDWWSGMWHAGTVERWTEP